VGAILWPVGLAGASAELSTRFRDKEKEMRRTIALAAVALVLASSGVMALNSDDELWIPAAARGAGNAGSFWITDLMVMNISEEQVNVDITWLERGADNSEAEGVPFEIGAGETLVLEDIISAVFGKVEAAGAIHIEVAGDEDKAGEDEENAALVATARIYNFDDGVTFGQGFEGLVSDAAISAEDEDPTHVIGISDSSAFRSNWYGLNITEDDEGEPADAEVLVELLDLAGEVLASESFTMPPMAPLLYPVSGLGAGMVANATLRFTMIEGEAIFGASKVDEETNDPTTLEAHWECETEDKGDEEFSDEFFIDGCTFATTGRNPYFVLVPGFQLVLEGEEDNEEIELRITVLDETHVVDGVETRVVEEHETVDGEVAEISRNYLAFCTQTGSVFYFGEDVDIYEGGVVVSHDGAWLAGEGDNEPGIIMPGTVLVGSRYVQEIAPGVAMDRAEHVATDVTAEVEAGTFEGCLQVEETTPLEPGAEGDKVYAPGIGLVIDDVLELVEYTDPAAP
jgi:hypothetical protein